MDQIIKTNVYCDESSINDIDYIVIGGLWITPTCERKLLDAIRQFRNRINFFGEFHWESISKRYIEYYLDFIYLFFQSKCRINCLVINKKIYKNPQYNNNNQQIGFYKSYFFLISRKIRNSYKYYVFIDDRTNHTQYRINDLRKIINNWCIREKKSEVNEPIMSISILDSKQNDLMQIIDLVVGSVSRFWNHRDKFYSRTTAKDEFANFLCMSLNRKDLGETSPEAKKINIWNFEIPELPF